MRFIPCALLASIVLAAPVQAQSSAPSIADIRAIEQQIVMPSTAGAVSGYDRFYALTTRDGHAVIKGVLVSGHNNQHHDAISTPIANAYTTNAETLPVIMDGGCSVVTTYFDVASRTLMPIAHGGGSPVSINASCNGYA